MNHLGLYKFSALALILVLTGCGTNSAFIERATPVMAGDPYCMGLITRTGLGSYNHLATVGLGGKGVISVATNGTDSMCGLATTFPGDVYGGVWGGLSIDWQQVEQISLARCEQNKNTYKPNIKAPCKVFSRNYTIVYDKELSDEK